jgi:hypothetical protein
LIVIKRLLILAGILMTGCAAQPPVVTPVTMVPGEQFACAALAFDAPITLDEPAINPSRSNRGAAAFVGFEDNTISYYDIISDNRQTTDFSDRFVRESVTEHIGSTRR